MKDKENAPVELTLLFEFGILQDLSSIKIS